MEASRKIKFTYTNHAGNEEERHIIPIRLYFGVVKPWYPEPTWLVQAFDLDRNSTRDFQFTKMINIQEM